jgi:hypothetical protein
MSGNPKKEDPSDLGSKSALTQQALEHLDKALRGLRFGEVKLVVQDGVIVQIDRLEKKRLDRDS